MSSNTKIIEFEWMHGQIRKAAGRLISGFQSIDEATRIDTEHVFVHRLCKLCM
jgi:hypothetical protein